MAMCNSNNERLRMAPLPSAIRMRLGTRELLIRRDTRRRYCPVNLLLHCRTGLEPGYLELLLLRKWLVVFSRARQQPCV